MYAIKNNLQKYRVWKKLTQTELAKCVEISINQLRKIEHDGYYPKYMIRQKICNYFGILQTQMFYKGES
jgi:DNA-binding XRE family transcriptional regulator